MRSIICFLFAFSVNAQTNQDSLVLSSLSREDSSLLTLTPLKVNSPQSDYSPLVWGGNLYFVSARPSNLGVVYADASNRTDITDMFYAPLRTPVKTAAARPFDIHTRFYEGPFTFSRGGDTIYFSGNDPKSTNLKIMMSVKTKDRWSKPAIVNFCSDSFAYCHPSLSPDGKLYLSANQRTGGDMDIFVSSQKNGIWLPPLNLGDSVNTDSNEVFPYAGRQGHLYFSSNRQGGIGNLDLYHLLLQAGDVPMLMYPPLNSEADDFGFYADSSGQTGYLSSNRKGSRGDDLYYFERSIPDFSRSSEPPVRTRFCYTFYEATTASAADTSILYYEWSFGDGSRARGLSTRHCYTATGTFPVELSVVEKISGAIDTSLVRYEIQIPEQERLKIIAPDSAVMHELVTLDASESSVKDHEITNTYWSFGDGFYNRGPVVGHRYRKDGKYVVDLWVTARHRQSGAEQKYKTTRSITVRAIN